MYSSDKEYGSDTVYSHDTTSTGGFQFGFDDNGEAVFASGSSVVTTEGDGTATAYYSVHSTHGLGGAHTYNRDSNDNFDGFEQETRNAFVDNGEVAFNTSNAESNHVWGELTQEYISHVAMPITIGGLGGGDIGGNTGPTTESYDLTQDIGALAFYPLGFGSNGYGFYASVTTNMVAFDDHEHHLFPREFEETFKKDFPELDIDEFTSMLDKNEMHSSVDPNSKLGKELAEKGLPRSKGGQWNSDWKNFLNSDDYKNSKNKKKAILEKMFDMTKRYDLDITDLSRYHNVRGVTSKAQQNNARALAKLLELSEENGVSKRKFGKKLKELTATLAKTPFGKKIIEEAAGPLRKMIRSTKGSLGKYAKKVPYLGIILFGATANAHGGEAAAADLIGVDANIVREFIESGKIKVALNPWLLYPQVKSHRHYNVGDQIDFAKGGKYVGRAKVRSIYVKPDGSVIVVFEGTDGSGIPVEIPDDGKGHLPDYFPFFDKPDGLEVPDEDE